MKKHSVKIAGHATSITLEDAFWDELKDEAGRQGKSINALIAEIDEMREENLSSAIRVYLLKGLQSRL
ncbi:MAG: ribbon-helix-helix domain-containing protein [Alphaproteobacteria bacterium]|nr:ribbon-helix-helix domain-containing protein [Alphaproteobacteria bacterium]